MFSRDSLHHAYFIEGEKHSVLKDLEDFLRDAFNITRHGNPDVYYTQHDSFGIDESKDIQIMQSMKPVMGGKKIFIITLSNMTVEAQNSLLKVFEEPTPETHFFIISSSRRILLPTLQSRLIVISHPSAKDSLFDEQAREFIELSPKDRLAYVGRMIEDKDKNSAENFIDALINRLRKKDFKSYHNQIKEMISIKKYLKDRSPSLKLILERVALLDL